MERYNPKKIETKWKARWLSAKIYEPDFSHGKSPFYNLMMFPYPSAEGLHIGGVRTFTGVDIYGRFKRMQGLDVFEPIGLDGFGIHSENYALKIGKHPAKLATVTEKNFYRQLSEIGNGFAWQERLETYDPEYYKWTQWIFIQLFKRGLAYRKKAAVNWCPSCKTVLADEQVVAGKCERCSSAVDKRELEQWFFKITDYAERLLQNIEKIDWDAKVKIAQKNWIGKSEGAEIDFEIRASEKLNFVILHGYEGSPDGIFFLWLRDELQKRGYAVQAPALPNAKHPNLEEQISSVLKTVKFDENTIVFGHSLGSVVALKTVERLNHPVRKLVLAAGFARPPSLRGKSRDYEKTFDWKFDFGKIKKNAGEIVILSDSSDTIVPPQEAEYLESVLGGRVFSFPAVREHMCALVEPEVLRYTLDMLTVFTTRPDTLFGATYMVLAPEHPLVANSKSQITNYKEVEEYIRKTKTKSDEERIREGKEKTGVELKGIKAINPANKEEIPVFVADYVLGNVGTGAIMAVPAHDQRDFDFAKKFKLPIKIVICPHWPEKICPLLDTAYTGEGYSVDSGEFDGMPSKEARKKISDFVGGVWKTQYRLRDWLISRQRYWGPPIPMIFCESCNWHPVPEKDLPVKLPFVKNFRPTGSGKSPLASVKSFYETKCPKCEKRARRETDVSDTFLDSAWYFIGYLMTFENCPDSALRNRGSSIRVANREKLEIGNSAFSRLARKWLPVNMYIGGLEHSVLHLLYSRFITMALHDIGLLDFEEPFTKFIGHGLITKDGTKMSKSKGNVVNPDQYIRAYGADAMRMYLAFLAPLTEGGDFRDSGIKGITRFLERVWKFAGEIKFEKMKGRGKPDSEIEKAVNEAVKKVTKDTERLQYNTSISALMVLINIFEEKKERVTLHQFKIFLKLLAPFAPFMAEELYQRAQKGKFQSIHREPWPKYDESILKESSFDLIIQVNGKVRGKISLPTGATEAEAREAALKLETVRQCVFSSPACVPFIKLTLSASSDGDVTVNSITVEHQGVADDSALVSIVILDESKVQLGLEKPFNVSHRATLTEKLVVKAGTSCTLWIAANMNTALNQGVDKIGRLVVVAIDAGTAPVNGLPISQEKYNELQTGTPKLTPTPSPVAYMGSGLMVGTSAVDRPTGMIIPRGAKRVIFVPNKLINFVV